MELFIHLKPSIEKITEIPSNTPKVYDAMMLFQKLPPTLMTFGDILDFVLQKIIKNSCRVCFFITDYYLPDSVKSIERKSRSNIGLLRMKATRRDQRRPKQINKFLRLAENKIDLVKSLIEEWSTNNYCVTLDGKELYITLEEDKAYRITSNRENILKTNEEEFSRQ